MSSYNGDPAKDPSNPLWRLFVYIRDRGQADRPTTGQCAYFMGVDRLTVRAMLKRLNGWVASNDNPNFHPRGKRLKGSDPVIWQIVSWKSDNDPFPTPYRWKPGGDSLSYLDD